MSLDGKDLPGKFEIVKVVSCFNKCQTGFISSAARIRVVND